MGNEKQATNLVDVLTTDHRTVEAILSELERAEGTPEHRRDLAAHAITEVVRHSVAEEQYVLPLFRRVDPAHSGWADQEIEANADLERLMKDLEREDPTTARFEELVSEFIRDVRQHVRSEENEILPQLHRSCTTGELAEVGSAVLRAKDTAPTHPHPAAPDRPPLNRLMDPGAGMVDRMRDALAGRKKEQRGR
ncbi:hemerythrin domain-containing protein [Actinoalloteichus spitiensis]|uniref:hemerythrin domain-containing protein n=1 Tax=Actinoalloteichus spitiensis TaxID=252394 RepID=UPI00036E5D40|nr:hemerythrin domain-containing protein [Actinoalloteichus spitiensis]